EREPAETGDARRGRQPRLRAMEVLRQVAQACRLAAVHRGVGLLVDEETGAFLRDLTGDGREEAAEVGHDASGRRARWRRMSAFVELSWGRGGSVALSSSGMMRCASCFPSSTPHWSNESMCQITPCVKTLCS